MYELTIHAHFDAAHRLRNYEGKCSRLHGHTWQVQAFVRGDHLDQTGMLVDFKILKTILSEIVDGFDHRNLNELPDFDDNLPGTLNPTAENIAQYIYNKMRRQLLQNVPGVKLTKVQVWEAPGAGAAYWED